MTEQQLQQLSLDYWSDRAEEFSALRMKDYETSMRESFLQFIKSQLPPIKDRPIKALDLGCGAGFFCLLLKELGCQVTGIDFSKIASEQLMNKIMNTTYNINAAVANTGSGNVTTENVNASNFQQIVNAEQKDELQTIIDQIETIAKEHNLPEILDYTNNMKSEIEKPESKKSFLKMALNAIKGVATGIVANQLTPLVTQALALL